MHTQDIILCYEDVAFAEEGQMQDTSQSHRHHVQEQPVAVVTEMLQHGAGMLCSLLDSCFLLYCCFFSLW